MPVWSNTGNPPGPLNYKQIEDLIAFIRAEKGTEYRVHGPDAVRAGRRPGDGQGEDVRGLGRPELQAGAGRDAVPGLLDRRVHGAGAVARRRAARPARLGSPGRLARRRPARSCKARRAQHRVRRRKTLSAPADAPFQIEFDNQDAGIPHNVEIKDANGTAVFKGEIITGAGQGDLRRPGARRRHLHVRLHGAPEHDRHAHGGGLTDGPDRPPRPRPARPPAAGAFFGLFDADGWPWAIVKALFWFVVIIILLGYIPDRAYYFTVQRTVDVGLLAWSPVNFCPPENETLPCPAPAGATLPWQPRPAEIQLPAAAHRRRGRP